MHLKILQKLPKPVDVIKIVFFFLIIIGLWAHDEANVVQRQWTPNVTSTGV